MNSKHVLVVQCVRCCTLRTFFTNSCRSISVFCNPREEVAQVAGPGEHILVAGAVVEASLHATNAGSLHAANAGSLHATNAGVADRSKVARLENFFWCNTFFLMFFLLTQALLLAGRSYTTRAHTTLAFQISTAYA